MRCEVLPKFLPAGFYFLVRGHCYLNLVDIIVFKNERLKNEVDF